MTNPAYAIGIAIAWAPPAAGQENTDDGIVIAVRMQSDGEDISELVFRFSRID